VGRALDSVRQAKEALTAGMTPDAVLSVTETACAALGELTGRSVKDDIITDIFSRFCVGK
jgi:tRNA modification GTPase